MQPEELRAGLRLEGVLPNQVVTVIAAQAHGADAVELTYKTTSGAPDQRVLFRDDIAEIRIAMAGSRAFDAAVSDFTLAAEAQRISMAGLSDPMVAVATSDVQPLPHQIRAVYDELLPRTPLRFLLADDPGAGKTIMAGLYIKELILRDDVRRCLIVAPGGLVEQWQDELLFKFGLRFHLLTNDLIDANVNLNVFETHPLLIARMDHLSRNERLWSLLDETTWDLVIVDEAHRMGAHYFGGKLEKTKRFQLGERLRETARHLLLLTATPHSGKEEDFQLFLTLLDRDRFEGKNHTAADTSGIMRRMIKEELRTFEGKRLFPERRADTVPYELTASESHLYEQVTAYVRDGMNRAERVGGKRKNTIGFALTVLQRRLASSPEAIYQSLVRRSQRLERMKRDIGTYVRRDENPDVSDIDADHYSASELEDLESDLVDSATAAETLDELNAELSELADLIRVARDVRDNGADRKWTEFSKILQDHALTSGVGGVPRKLIVFTEHRDTLEYLVRRIGSLLGHGDAVRAIHGGVRREDRRLITEQFTKDGHCRVLVATDAAGEGLNLQAAHLMVNYDLPWNPNRIEQRFGRIHRIGQEQVCRLWNLVASNTREGDVFIRLLDKIREQSEAYGGKVFDVLGEAFSETPLRDLLVDAIKYGERADVKARMNEVIDRSVGDGLTDLLDQRALATELLSESDLAGLQTAMDDARRKRVEAGDVERVFRAVFAKFGGRIVRRERGRFEIPHVPAQIRASDHGPIVSRYERVTFDLACVQPDGDVRADLLAPGHPLHDAVMETALDQYVGALNRGTVLVSQQLHRPQLLVGIIEEIADATGDTVAKRFGYVYVSEDGAVSDAGAAPYLSCTEAPAGTSATAAKRLPWLAEAENRAKSWIISNRLSDYLDEIQPRREADLTKTRELVTKRLMGESERLTREADTAEQKERVGEKPKESAESLRRKAHDLDVRFHRRMDQLEQQMRMTSKPPQIRAAALVLSEKMLTSLS